ncbi:HAD family hydrolase [Marinomonas epiphytica]
MTVHTEGLTTIAFDADDTLWRNEDIFVSAQDEFVRLLLGYHDDQFIRQHLAKVQIKNLNDFGYGIKGFTLSMIETAIELTEGRITGKEIHQVIELARRMLASPIEVLPGVEKVLAQLHGKYRLMVITKGDLLDQESKVAKSGLAKYFDLVEVVSEKNPVTYQSLLNKHKIELEEFLMIGNSMKSDVLPIYDLGGQAIHIPYHLTWDHEVVDDAFLTDYPKITRLESIEQLDL